MTYIDHFKDSQVASQYDQREYAAGSYNELLTEIEVGLIEEALEDLCQKQDARLIDFACGAGRFLPVLSKLSRNVVGVDVSSQMLDIAATKVSQEVVLLCGDVRTPEGISELKRHGDFDGGCSMRFILNAERSVAIQCLSAISELMSLDSIFLVNNHSRPVSHKAVSAIRNRLRGGSRVVGNTLSDKNAVSLLEAGGFKVVGVSGYGFLGNRLSALIGVDRARAIESRVPKRVLLAVGSHRMYSLMVDRTET